MAVMLDSKPRRRNGVMRASHRDANEGFEGQILVASATRGLTNKKHIIW